MNKIVIEFVCEKCFNNITTKRCVICDETMCEKCAYNNTDTCEDCYKDLEINND